MKKWHDIYKEITEELFKFYKKHEKDPSGELYKVLTNNPEFIKHNSWLGKFKPAFDVESVDPIHIFSSFNGNTMSEQLRTTRINLLLSALSPDNYNQYHKINFDGCPTPTIINLLSVRFREEQQEIWDLFVNIYNDPKSLNQDHFDQIKNWFGVEIASFTIFLFWINSDDFLPLDNNTLGFLLAVRKIDARPKDFNDYYFLLRQKTEGLFRAISKLAYEVMYLDQKNPKYLPIINTFLGPKSAEVIQHDGNFRIVAIKPIKGKNLKSLEKNKIYRFYHSFEFKDHDKEIVFDKEKDYELYNLDDIKVNISAIVGKNGSGKSTLSELLFLAINNLSYIILGSQEGIDLKSEDGTDLDLYVLTDRMYKIALRSQNVQACRYETKITTKENIFTRIDGDISVLALLKNSFFYTIALNYSLYALNTRSMGEWLHRLFHKNDAYQTPVVINPMRTEGKIDINKENELAHARLLFMLLMPLPTDNKYTIEEKDAEEGGNKTNFRILVQNEQGNKTATLLKLKLNVNKLNANEANTNEKKSLLHIVDEVKDDFLPIIYEFYEIDKTYIDAKFESISLINKYLIYKLQKICITYPKYDVFLNNQKLLDKTTLKECLVYIETHPSHITFKFKQAVNFLKFDHLPKDSNIFEEDIEKLSLKIEAIRSKNNNISVFELIPPSIFDTEVFISDPNVEEPSPFSDFSSGEKQRVYSLSTIIYHLINLDSVSDDHNYLYNRVFILYDEIELYYHPELQREFIKDLLWSLNTLKEYLEKVKSFHFCFITHSPFILSDIPASNVLFLGGDPGNLQTFAANIHDLLANGFFLEKGLAGAFSIKTIEKTILTLSQWKTLKEESRNKEKFIKEKRSESLTKTLMPNEFEKKSILKTIGLIGDSLIKHKLKEMYYDIFPDDLSKEALIAYHKQQIKLLEG